MFLSLSNRQSILVYLENTLNLWTARYLTNPQIYTHMQSFSRGMILLYLQLENSVREN